jgi:predicted 2-oxoglutarate/Fe(II)-dependent dioxygenase YbiX
LNASTIPGHDEHRQSAAPVRFESPAPGVFLGELVDPADCHKIVSELSQAQEWVDAEITVYRGEDGKRVESMLDPDRRLARRIHFRGLDLSAQPLLTSFLKDVRRHVLPLIVSEFGLKVCEIGEAELVHYPPGGLFTPHSDANVVKPYRAFSVLLYLNDDFQGGETAFPDLGFSCQPRKGRVLVFPSHMTHGGNPVTAGTKDIIVMWVFYPGTQDEYPGIV